MLNASVLTEARRALQQGIRVHELAGLCLATQEVLVDDPGTDPVQQGNLNKAEFYPPTRLFGTPVDPTCLQDVLNPKLLSLPKGVVRHVRNARIIGNASIIDFEGYLYAPDLVDNRDKLRAALTQNKANYDGYLLHQSQNGVQAVYLARKTPRSLPIDAVFFHNLESGNYGSFLIRQLSQLIVLRDFCEAADAYIVPERTSWLREALDALRLPERPIYTCKEVSGDLLCSVTFVDNIDAEGFVSPSFRAELQSVLGLQHKVCNTFPEKIFVSRALSTISRPSYRVAVNELAIEQEAIERGFAVVHPETMSFRQQARLFSKARVIAGLSGSGMLNAMFSIGGVKILDLESFHYTVRQHAKLYSSSGAEYSFLFGEINGDGTGSLAHRNWNVPLDLFRDGLQWLLTGT